MSKLILVADDDLSTRKLLGLHLRKLGHTTMFASDGIRARMALEDNPHIAVLICDVIMPGIDCRELVAGLRRDERYAALPVIVMSATVGVKAISGLLNAGASRFMAKPIQLDRLRQELEPLLAS